MAWKIKDIRIKNFKVFLHTFDKFKPEGKNVLIYGENGSGKSSIYWAIYTIFQSCLKEPTANDAGKYFNPSHPDNLRNLFDKEGIDSGIEISFMDENGRIKGFNDASWGINTKEDSKFMEKSVFASDFMNYKFLSAIFDFKNSKLVDLFNIFEEEVFPFLMHEKNCYDLDGTSLSELGFDFWWKKIQYFYNTPGVLSKRSRNSNTFKHDSKWHTFQNLINDFNAGLENKLTEIANEANNKLLEFNTPVKISLSLEQAAFDIKIPGTRKSYDGKFYKPKIILSAQLLDNMKNPVSDMRIMHPRSFFNEAKLTRMALAIRLAIFDRKLQDDDCAKVLVVDDLLISLDMSNRLLVVNKLLDYVDKYQLFIFTHDRAFYNMICDSISQRNISKSWKYYEMYSIDKDISQTQVPETWLMEPRIRERQNYMQQSRAFFSEYEYYAAANSLRKECEKQLRRLYPKNWTLSTNSDGTVSMINLNGLIQKLDDFYLRYNFKTKPTSNIDQYRKRILNPASHNDDKACIFRSELIMAINEIAEFEKIEKYIVSKIDEIGNRTFIMSIEKDERHITFEFTPKEEWSILKYKDILYFEGIAVKQISISGMKLKADKEHTVLSVWKRACKFIGFPEEGYPDLGEIITDKDSGKKLSELLL